MLMVKTNNTKHWSYKSVIKHFNLIFKFRNMDLKMTCLLGREWTIKNGNSLYWKAITAYILFS